MDIIGIIAAIGIVILVFTVVIRIGNIVLELRKLNKEFNKFYHWIYSKIETGEKTISKSDNEKKTKEMNPKLKDFIEKGKIF